MDNLSPLQFSPRDRTLPGMPFPLPESQRPRRALGPIPKQWSGPIPGQLAMGVHDLGDEGYFDQRPNSTDMSRSYEADGHGFLYEPRNLHGFEAPADDEMNGGDGIDARHFYKTVGGGLASNPEVQMHWAAQPLVQIRSDTPVHTAQHWFHETETGNGNPLLDPSRLEGRLRIDAMRHDIQRGESLPPVWIMKHNQRLFSLDGHHRIVAFREAGMPTYPARLWDTDAEKP